MQLSLYSPCIAAVKSSNGKMNLWAMDLPDTYPYLFAHQDESCSFIEFDLDGRYVLAGFDKDGDETIRSM